MNDPRHSTGLAARRTRLSLDLSGDGGGGWDSLPRDTAWPFSGEVRLGQSFHLRGQEPVPQRHQAPSSGCTEHSQDAPRGKQGKQSQKPPRARCREQLHLGAASGPPWLIRSPAWAISGPEDGYPYRPGSQTHRLKARSHSPGAGLTHRRDRGAR